MWEQGISLGAWSPPSYPPVNLYVGQFITSQCQSENCLDLIVSESTLMSAHVRMHNKLSFLKLVTTMSTFYKQIVNITQASRTSQKGLIEILVVD